MSLKRAVIWRKLTPFLTLWRRTQSFTCCRVLQHVSWLLLNSEGIQAQLGSEIIHLLYGRRRIGVKGV